MRKKGGGIKQKDGPNGKRKKKEQNCDYKSWKEQIKKLLGKIWVNVEVKNVRGVGASPKEH